MSTVQLPGSNRFDSQMQIHTGNQIDELSLAKEFQPHMTKENRKSGFIDQVINKKYFMEIKWTDINYHDLDDSDIAHQYVKTYCNTNQFPALPFCGTHSKPHGTRGLSKHHHLRVDTKLGNGICAILRIPYVCVACTSMLDKYWISCVPSYEQERYKPVTNCTYWPLLESFNNEFDEIHQVVLVI